MIYHPKTLEEAMKYRYGEWAGNPEGRKYKAGYCAYEIWSLGGWVPFQCNRKNGYGSDNLYCKQHAKMIGDK